MPAIQVRPIIFTDISALVAIDHSYTSEYVWQMDFQEEGEQVRIAFNERRLPRAMRVEYRALATELGLELPHEPSSLAELHDGLEARVLQTAGLLDMRLAIQRIANEQAEIPASGPVLRRPVIERWFALDAGLGRRLQEAIAVEVGTDRAAELQLANDGWPDSRWQRNDGTCPP